MTKIHNNEFTFIIEGLSEISFIEKEHKITKGQPYEGISCKGNTLVVKAGRHNSGDVAKWFLNSAKERGVIAKTFNDEKPEALNFAVRGTLLLHMKGVTYTFDDFVIGQGHFEFNNNWWIGSKEMFGVTWDNVNQQYAEQLVQDSLSVVSSIITEDPVGSVIDSAKLIVDVLNKRKVGSGSIAARTSESTTAVGLFLFQMDNSQTNVTMTGRYSHP
ncbi:flagellin [Vibrio splendidus]|uniref:flagellin n=1 Tax=Vibrio splendidus TaxID=29497 RepID=UPI000D3C42CA|nr:flagellin [Vibrio splendidus]PTO81985.1 flagellin [Vibrio splendidus]